MIAPPREPIAIIGIGCRFPGGIAGPASFWQALVEGVDAVTSIPAHRFATAPPAPGETPDARPGGVLDHLDRFDAAFFGMSPREAAVLDPQQRLLLEVAYEAMEDGGQRIERLAGSRTAVYAGIWLNDFESWLASDPESFELYTTLGTGRYSASGRISYAFGLQGPSVTVDSACSSSLVAVHLACRTLWSGECDLALAGGANVILQPHITIAYSRAGMLAADGRCKFGDARADGYVRSEGAAMVLLKPLHRALDDADPIHAVIRGSAVNNDGRSGESMVKPAPAGQEQMLRLAYRDAGVSPREVAYVEAHGTGTIAGDPIELGALAEVLGERGDRTSAQRCAVGSVKTNIGHTEGAAGVAGLIKAALVLRHRLVPPSVHFRDPNPALDWERLPLWIPREATPLPSSGRLVAGVSAFGIAGTNAHVVLESPPESLAERPDRHDARATIVTVSARSEAALLQRAHDYAERIQAAEETLDDLAFTAARRRSHHRHRLAVVGSSATEVVRRLRSLGGERDHEDAAIAWGEAPESRERIVFVFPGQGSQWAGMGRALLETEPVFRAVIDDCEQAMRPFADWSLLERLRVEEESPSWAMGRIDVVQPALVAIEIALAALWRSWGIEPDAVVGHSLGEVAAAHVAGALTIEDAMRVICVRSRLMRQVSGAGAMAVVELSRTEAEGALRGIERRVSVAASNGPRSTIISGDPGAVDAVLRALERREVFGRLINVDVASHSAQMEPLRERLAAELHGIRPRATTIDFFSTVEAALLEGKELDAGYWSRNLRQPVLFREATELLIDGGNGHLLEVSPHPVLLPAIEQTVRHMGGSARVSASLRRGEPERESLLRTLGALYVAGHDVAWEVVHATGRCVSLPAYPWQRQRHWSEPAPRAVDPSAAGRHPIFGGAAENASGSRVWQGRLDLSGMPLLGDHRVRGRAVVPAAAFLEAALSAAGGGDGDLCTVVEDLTFESALVLDETASTDVQVVSDPVAAGDTRVAFFSRPSAGSEWTRHATGTVRTSEWTHESTRLAAEARAVNDALHTGAEHYALAHETGLEYGDRFRAILSFGAEGRAAAARIGLPASLMEEVANYRLHPALLDGALQLLLRTLPTAPRDETWLPIRIDRVRAAPHGRGVTWARAEAVHCASSGDPSGDIVIRDDSGRVLLIMEGVSFRRVRHRGDERLTDWLYQMEWRESPPSLVLERELHGTWIVLGDARHVTEPLCARLALAGSACVVARSGSGFRRVAEGEYELDPTEESHHHALLSQVTETRGRIAGIVLLHGMDAASRADADASEVWQVTRRLTHTLLACTRAVGRGTIDVTPRVWVVTAGAQPVAGQPVTAPAASALWGMAETIAAELPKLRCTCIDVATASTEAPSLSIAAELLAGDSEDRIGFRNGRRFVARLVRVPDAPSAAVVEHSPTGDALPPAWVLTTNAPGVLDGLHFRPTSRPRPARGEVEIEVRAAGLNFINVMSAMGVYPGVENGRGPLGLECAGVVVAVGEGVSEFHPGDEVVALATNSLATHARADARLVALKPTALSFEQAATMPAAFVTAWFALEQLARIRSGERVLIHSASGGLGLAAIQIARRAGAVVIATAGSEARREYLRDLGLDHVFDSRTLDFADDIMECTGGEGVDVVLNSLAGAGIERSLSVLRPFGRFVEVGKRDIHEGFRVSLRPFRNHLSFFAVDLLRLSEDRPVQVGEMLRAVMALARSGEITPLAFRLFGAEDVIDAFHDMAQARHIGKIVVGIPPGASLPGAPVAPVMIRTDATYLITGGLGALGLAIGRWLAERGARHIVLIGRSRPDATAIQRLVELEALGARVSMHAADVTNADELARVVASIEAELPPLRGIIHGAGVLADGTLLEIDTGQFDRAMAPKVTGAWLLHGLTRHMPLDFFLLHSSAASLVGLPGQANYAAANAFLDGLAHLRRACGLPALSINWGPWSEIGLAVTRDGRGDRLAREGLESLAPHDAMEALDRLLFTGAPQVGVMRLDVARWCAMRPEAGSSPRLTELRTPARGKAISRAAGSATDTASIVTLLLSGTERDRVSAMERFVREQLGRVFRVAPDDVPLRTPLKQQGLDSLMSLELRNRLEGGLGITVPATAIWNYPTVAQLAVHLLDRISAARPATTELLHASLPHARSDGREITAGDSALELQLEWELAAVDELLMGD